MLGSLTNRIHSTTMYHLVLYGLWALVALSLIFSITGALTLPFSQLIASLFVLLIVSQLSTMVFARLWRVTPFDQSWMITALILYCIMAPASSLQVLLGAALAAVLATASKFVLAWNGRHIFNPAALGAAVVTLSGISATTWWIGTPLLAPFIVLFGAAIIYKMRHATMAVPFVVVSILATVLVATQTGQDAANALRILAFSSPLLFLGAFMLTEPSTAPNDRTNRLIYGALVGLLFASQLSFVTDITPEIALLIANVFSFASNPRQAVRLTLTSINKLRYDLYELRFTSNKLLQHRAGQYMQWTLPVAGDVKGNRRTFTIASAPGTNEVVLGIRARTPLSKYKQTLLALKPGTTVQGNFVAGEFVLPSDTKRPVVLIAGGIGITPFISMLDDLVRRRESRPMQLIYATRQSDDVFGMAVLEAAKKAGVEITHIIGDQHASIAEAKTLKIIQKPNSETLYYVSGTPGFVASYRNLLLTASITNKNIKTDSFSGY